MNTFLHNRRKERRQSLKIDNFGIQDQNDPYVRHVDVDSILSDGVRSTGHSSIMTNSASNKTDEINKLSCSICGNNDSLNMLVLASCGHVYHIKCIGNSHMQNTKQLIDKNFLENQKCQVCHEAISSEDLGYIHTKHFKFLKDAISDKDATINLLNNQIAIINEELRVHYENKQRLESQRDISKQITIVANTLL